MASSEEEFLIIDDTAAQEERPPTAAGTNRNHHSAKNGRPRTAAVAAAAVAVTAVAGAAAVAGVVAANAVAAKSDADGRRRQRRARNGRRVLSQLGRQRRKTLEEAQEQILRRQKLNKKLKQAKTFVSKLNIGRWIDELEKDQELADQLEEINRETQQEQERQQLVRDVKAACMDAVKEHLESFLQENPQGTYEDWIEELHPDNVDDDTNMIDARFYVVDSDHRILWNEHHDDGRQSLQVEPSSTTPQPL